MDTTSAKPASASDDSEPRRHSAAAALPTPAPLAPPAPLPQYYIHFGRCSHNLQQMAYGTWVMTRPLRMQTNRDSVVFMVDTKNASPVAPAFGSVVPAEFQIRQINIAYFDYLRGVQAWSPDLDKRWYMETGSYYAVRVNGKRLTTTRDLKDSGVKTPETSVYSLKGSLMGAITPSTQPYKLEVVKWCALSKARPSSCDQVPDPASVFVNERGYFAYSFWNVGQPLTVNGVPNRDHAWCPVQTGITVP
jgi:hypothetical protein